VETQKGTGEVVAAGASGTRCGARSHAVMLTPKTSRITNTRHPPGHGEFAIKSAQLPKAVGAAATLAIILGAVGWGLNSLQPEALDVLDIVPRATQKLYIALRGNPLEHGGAVEKMQIRANTVGSRRCADGKGERKSRDRTARRQDSSLLLHGVAIRPLRPGPGWAARRCDLAVMEPVRFRARGAGKD
jgi:hypothetical protein